MSISTSYRKVLYTFLLISIPLLVILFMIGLFGDPKTVQAAGTIYYLNKDHANAADAVDAGTATKPFKTLVYAYSRISNGDTIYVAAPSSTTPVVYNETSRIVATKYFNLVGQGTHPSDIIFTFNNSSQMVIPNTANGPTLFQNVGFHVGGQGAQAAGFDATTGVRDFTLDNVYILSDATQYVINTIAGTTGLTIKNSQIVINTGGFFKDVNSGNFTLDNNTITVNAGAIQNGIIFQSTTSTTGGTATITHNTITDYAGMSPISLIFGGHTNVIVEDNTIQASGNSVRDIINLQNQGGYSVRRNSLTSTSTAIGSAIMIKSPSGTSTIAYIEDNVIDTYTLGTHAIFLSSEGGGVDHVTDSLSGSYISGNTLTNGSSHGIVGDDLTHQIMVGYNRNVFVHDNVVNGGGYGVVIKGDNTWTSGGIYNNKFLYNDITGIRVKGPQNVPIYNNIITMNDGAGDCINISANTVPVSTGTKFYNNKCHVVTGVGVSIQNDGSDVGSDFHDNIYSIGPSATGVGSIRGTTYSTFAEWKAATGLETGSIVRNLRFDTDYDIVGTGAPTSTHFSTDLGTTDFSTVVSLTDISHLKLATTTGSIQWTNSTNVENVDLDAGVIIDKNFVSVDPTNASLDAPATVSLAVDSCSPVPTIYYATSFYSTAADIIAHGVACNGSTATACLNISCVGNTMTFDVPHFDGFAVQQVINNSSNSDSGGYRSIVLPKPLVRNISILSRNQASSTVKILLDVADATQMAFSEDENFVNTSFIPFATETIWKIPHDSAEKKIYIRFTGYFGQTVTDTAITIGPTTTTHISLPEPITPSYPHTSSSSTPSSQINELTRPSLSCPLAAGGAYKIIKNSAVWYITENCTRRLFKNSDIYFSYFDSWKKVLVTDEKTLNKVQIDGIPFMNLGPKAKLKTGDLVKIINSPRVYYIFSPYKYWIETEEAFKALKLSWTKILDISQELMDKYPEKKSIKTKEDFPS